MIISLLLAVFATAGGTIIVLALICAFIISMALQNKKNPGTIECKPVNNSEKINVRYRILDVRTMKIVDGSDDYLEACNKKRKLGEGFMIKDRDYVKKRIFL